ncbi:unnamed protein product [Gongylonema pulchrum]|uniref:DNA helicase n=1 Tax=Gongylonema pulchrum TaxID=637853 RepID=A0A183DI27_9BILA|nr:unnamed protein product [Gongylonema pulchrum]
MRQLDDITQVFDPEQKSTFLSQTLHNSLPIIPEVGYLTLATIHKNQMLSKSVF